MARLSITDLSPPDEKYSPVSADPCERTGNTFDILHTSQDEDLCRAQLVRESCRKADPPFDVAEALELADLLFRSGAGECDAHTLASAVYMRSRRIAIGGALWQLADSNPNVRTWTVRPRPWEITPTQLMLTDPKYLLAGFRSVLNRQGAADACGYSFAGLHAEFNPLTGKYELHLHGVGEGSILNVIDSLRHLPNFRQDIGKGDRTARVLMGRKPLTNLPYPLIYTVQSYWPCRWRGEIDGKLVRGNIRHRIPEPQHTQMLLWLNRYRLQDVTLLLGLRVTSEGLMAS